MTRKFSSRDKSLTAVCELLQATVSPPRSVLYGSGISTVRSRISYGRPSQRLPLKANDFGHT